MFRFRLTLMLIAFSIILIQPFPSMSQIKSNNSVSTETQENDQTQDSNFFTNSFKEFSIIWLIFSGAIGGIIGASVKFIFEDILGFRLKRSRDSKIALKKYSDPLLRAADSLDRRLENMIKFADKKWFDDKKDDYYKISTLYVFASYFGWSKIIENEAYLEFDTSKKEKKFYINFYRVYKGLTGFQYYKGLDENDHLERVSINRFVLTAIGELMIRNTANDSANGIITFIEFVEKYSTDKTFKKWLSYIEELFSDISASPGKWNRLILFATTLRMFIYSLDSSTRLTKSRKISLQNLHPKLKENLNKEIELAGYQNLVVQNP